MYNITGTGYKVELDGLSYNFPDFERAPSEGYLIQGYEA